MSDREVDAASLTLDHEVALLGAVLDELGLQRVALVGGSSGGCAAIAFAARFPERVDRLLLYGAYAHGPSIAPLRFARRSRRRSARTGGWGRACSPTSSSVRMTARRVGDSCATSAPSRRQRPPRHCWSSATGWTCAALLEQVRAPTVVVASPRRSRDPIRRGQRPRRIHTWRAAHQPQRRRPSSVGGRLDVGVASARLVSRGCSHRHGTGRSRGGDAAVATRARGARRRRRRAERSRDRRAHRRQPSHRAQPRRDIRRKLGSGSRAAAVAEASRLGLL